jgi:hypothetical protein
MTLDPRVSLYLNVAIAILTAIGAYSDVVGPEGVTTIAILVSILNAILHAIPSQSTPAAKASFYLGPKP